MTVTPRPPRGLRPGRPARRPAAPGGPQQRRLLIRALHAARDRPEENPAGLRKRSRSQGRRQSPAEWGLGTLFNERSTACLFQGFCEATTFWAQSQRA